MAILTNFAKTVDEMFRLNILTRLEGCHKVGEFGENGDFGESGNSDEISPRALTKCLE